MSTQHRDQLDLPTGLDRVEQRSKQDRRAEFNNLGHLIDLDLLERCYKGLKGSKAIGIDGVTKKEYGKNLDENLRKLLQAIRRGSYHPRASRITEIAKADGGTRPLAISCFEDKIVQTAVKRILEKIYEPLFLDVSHGFRPKRGCRTALVALDQHLMQEKCGGVLEIDLRKYFNTIPHEPLERLLRLKIKDERFLRLILKLLKAPIRNADGTETRNEIGSPQGSIVSPMLANLYLHYVIDIWFSWINDQKHAGSARMVRYADDAVFVFQSLGGARVFHKRLVERLKSFGISVHEGKTKVLGCGRKEATRRAESDQKMPVFTFLGFLHVWGKSKSRKTGKRFWRVKRRTCPLRLRKKLKEIGTYIREHRHEKDLIPHIKSVARGHLNYFAVNDNQERVRQFIHRVRGMLFKYLNRRSQRRSLTWEKFSEVLKREEFPQWAPTRNLFFGSSAQGPRPEVCW